MRLANPHLSPSSLLSLLAFCYSDRLDVEASALPALSRACDAAECGAGLVAALRREAVHERLAEHKAPPSRGGVRRGREGLGGDGVGRGSEVGGSEEDGEAQRRFILQAASLPEEERMSAAMRRLLERCRQRRGRGGESKRGDNGRVEEGIHGDTRGPNAGGVVGAAGAGEEAGLLGEPGVKPGGNRVTYRPPEWYADCAGAMVGQPLDWIEDMARTVGGRVERGIMKGGQKSNPEERAAVKKQLKWQLDGEGVVVQEREGRRRRGKREWEADHADWCFVVGGRVFRCHRCVVAARSEYFRVAFARGVDFGSGAASPAACEPSPSPSSSRVGTASPESSAVCSSDDSSCCSSTISSSNTSSDGIGSSDRSDGSGSSGASSRSSSCGGATSSTGSGGNSSRSVDEDALLSDEGEPLPVHQVADLSAEARTPCLGSVILRNSPQRDFCCGRWVCDVPLHVVQHTS